MAHMRDYGSYEGLHRVVLGNVLLFQIGRIT